MDRSALISKSRFFMVSHLFYFYFFYFYAGEALRFGVVAVEVEVLTAS
jgi:hypothetical protein